MDPGVDPDCNINGYILGVKGSRWVGLTLVSHVTVFFFRNSGRLKLLEQ